MKGRLLPNYMLKPGLLLTLSVTSCATLPAATTPDSVPGQVNISTEKPTTASLNEAKRQDSPRDSQAAATSNIMPPATSTSVVSEPPKPTTPVPNLDSASPIQTVATVNVGSLDRYLIQKNDILSRIASCFGVTDDELASLNSIEDKNKIFAGNTLFLPKGHTPPRSPHCRRGFRSVAEAEKSDQKPAPEPIARNQEPAKAAPQPSPERAVVPERPIRREQSSQVATVPKSQPTPVHALPTVEVKPPCLTAWNQSNKSAKGRRVLFVGGDMVNLFDKYFRDAEQANRRVDYESLIVMFAAEVPHTGAPLPMLEKRIKIQFEEWYQNMTPKKKWRQELTGLKAPAISNAEEAARNHGADLVCE